MDRLVVWQLYNEVSRRDGTYWRHVGTYSTPDKAKDVAAETYSPVDDIEWDEVNNRGVEGSYEATFASQEVRAWGNMRVLVVSSYIDPD